MLLTDESIFNSLQKKLLWENIFFSIKEFYDEKGKSQEIIPFFNKLLERKDPNLTSLFNNQKDLKEFKKVLENLMTLFYPPPQV